MRKLHNLPVHFLPVHVVAAVGLLAIGGCGNRIRGEIEDHEIKPKSVFFFSQSQVLGTDGLLGVVITDRKDGCADWGAYLAASAGVTSPVDQASNWAGVFQDTPDFWDITLLLRVTDPNVPVEGQAFAGVAWDAGLDAAGKASGVFVHNLQTRDQAYYDGTGQYGAYRSDYLSNGGTLEVDKHEPGNKLGGRFATFTVDAVSGEPTGLVEIYFDATFCPEADMLDNAGTAPVGTGTGTGAGTGTGTGTGTGAR